MEVGNIERLLEQVCWEIGFPVLNDQAQYVTGEAPEMTLNYPELLYYRDIVFTFKFMMTPTSKALPEIRPYTQNHATLMWRYDKDSKQFQVQGFGQLLTCAPPVDPEAMKKQQEADNSGVYAFLFGKDSRAGPSGADPSALVNEIITTEEDVLHVPTLPTFGNKLNQSASELLIQYLTVPYLRIPLLLNLLATPEHIGSLGNKQIQSILDGALFEPGMIELVYCFLFVRDLFGSGY